MLKKVIEVISSSRKRGQCKELTIRLHDDIILFDIVKSNTISQKLYQTLQDFFKYCSLEKFELCEIKGKMLSWEVANMKSAIQCKKINAMGK